jgi:ribonuclease HI
LTTARAWIDGASRGNPGDSGFGVLFEHDGQEDELLGFLGRSTNNVAEYAGLIAALSYARSLGLDKLTVHSDSELLVKQINGTYRVKAPHLLPLFLHALKLRRALPAFALRHVPRGENSRADGLANRAIDERAPLPAWLEMPG